jgi:hypothetical protein
MRKNEEARSLKGFISPMTPDEIKKCKIDADDLNMPPGRWFNKYAMRLILTVEMGNDALNNR